MKGKLYEATTADVGDNEWFEPSIIDALNEAKRELKMIMTLDQDKYKELTRWFKEQFGDD